MASLPAARPLRREGEGGNTVRILPVDTCSLMYDSIGMAKAKPNTVRVNILDVPQGLYHRFKVSCVERETSIRAELIRLMAVSVDQYERAKAARR